MAPADATRQRLLRAAIELFTARDYYRTTTPLIARKAGVAEGTIYRHFTGKQDLWNELYRGAFAWALTQLALVERRVDLSPREQLSELGRALAICAARDPAVIRLALLQPHHDLRDEQSRQVEQQFRTGVERMVARGKSDGTVRAGSAALWAGLWLAAVRHGLERLCTREWGADHPGIEQVLDGAWRSIALTPTAPSASRGQ